jgi:hypothetical protein
VPAVSAPEDCEPLSALVPGQVLEPEHEVAFFAAQVSVVEAPELTVLGLAVSVTEGANAETVTMADCVAEPPVPVHVSSNSVVLESAPVDQVPPVAKAPCQPPEAEQAVAFCDCQVRFETPPSATVDGDAARVIVGAGETTTTSADRDEEPPGPEQVSV